MEGGNSAAKPKAHLKVVIIGSVAVGKTAFVHRYFEKQFKETDNTIGALFSLKQWGPYSIAIWDTSGEERFRGLSTHYCRTAGAAVVAFDLTNEDTFHALRAIYVPLLESALADCVKIVIGTKSDLLATQPRAVSVEDAETLAREINPTLTGRKLYFETSSLQGVNVDEVFEAAFKLCEPSMRKLLDGEDGRSRKVDLNAEAGKKSSCSC